MLLPYEQIEVANGYKNVRAFVFSRNGKTTVVYWHTKGEGKVSLNLDAKKAKLFREPGNSVALRKISGGIVIPAGNRLFLETGTSIDETKAAFKNAEIL